MKLSKPLFFSFIFLLTIGNPAGVHASDNDSKKNGINGFRPTKLFVFGDSYSDTGNFRKSEIFSWRQPYGITFPGKPFGRFSDGRVLPDYIASFLGVKSPTPFRWMKYAYKRRLQYGMNFAFGASGVFDTTFLPGGLNMTTQIEFFQSVIDASVYTKTDLQSSMASLTVCGNDYMTYLFFGGTKEGLPAYTRRVINQVATDMKRLHNMGVKKVSIASMQPLGCLPRAIVQSSYRQCNDSLNEVAMLHNSMLQKMVARLNSQTPGSPYFILDLYSPFITIIKQKKLRQGGSRRFETPMKPCCAGVSEGYDCSSVDKNGVKMYTMCSDPNAAFFWDGAHPTQVGWSAIYDALKPTLHEHLF
ncbi:PREDICTED: GDSL esterase/lipase At5g03610-like [Ipomoea nil]|uniref:GDSL esterase/lipase At5g03610-like n=1 Tax=Ipomoea nil TaxID=35883 RepID=UPI0009017262|nr:PREDICTED: GDSL esterase/lipase At5g03610-like [Ipomoea nil]